MAVRHPVRDQRVCSISGCDGKHLARGFCYKHYCSYRYHAVTADKNRRIAQAIRYNQRYPERRCFSNAKSRCTNPNDTSWKNYGARGIRFLFKTFEEFFCELGCRPEGMTVDRINNDGNYEPGNVRWATRSEQQKNRRR